VWGSSRAYLAKSSPLWAAMYLVALPLFMRVNIVHPAAD